MKYRNRELSKNVTDLSHGKRRSLKERLRDVATVHRSALESAGIKKPSGYGMPTAKEAREAAKAWVSKDPRYLATADEYPIVNADDDYEVPVEEKVDDQGILLPKNKLARVMGRRKTKK